MPPQTLALMALSALLAVLLAVERSRRAAGEREIRFPTRLALLAEREAAEAALRESEVKFREAFHGASLGIALVDPTGSFVDWNDALERMVGYTAEELAHLHFQDLLLPEDREGSVAAFGALVCGERDHNDMERRYVRKDGRVLHLHYRVAALRDGGGRLHRAIGIIEDVTARIEAESERQRMQANLVLSDRMASLGLLAASVGHEINNPLSCVVGNLEEARADVARLKGSGLGGPAVTSVLASIGDALGEAAEGAERVRRIAGDLRVLSSPGDAEVRERVDVRAVLQSSFNLARRLIAERARPVDELREVPAVAGSAPRLGQVFLNLLVNAAQAIPPGDAERHRVRVACSVAPDGRVAMEVQDTGSGIPRDRLQRIFTPFFTTKRSGEGTGLGLAICQSIVAAHGGEIQVETEEGRGSTFRVLLPVASEDPVPAPKVVDRAPVSDPTPRA